MSIAPADAATKKTVNPAIVLFSTGLSMFAVFLDTTILYVAFPSISASFSDVSPSGMSWVLNAYTIVFAATLIPAGRLADRIGRRRTFLASVIVFTVASMLCGIAPTAPILVAARVLQAIGAAAMVPSSLALVLQTFPKERMPRAVAIWGAIGAVAGAAGPSIGSLVVDKLDWRWAFFINLPVGLISYFVGTRVLPEGRERTATGRPDLIGAVILMAGLAVLAWGIVDTEHTGWGAAQFWIKLAVSLALIGIFLRRCATHPAPVLNLELFRSPNFRYANIAMLVYATGFSAMFLGNILFLTTIWNYSILKAGLAISMGPAIVAILAPRLGQLSARIGQRAILIPGGIVWASSAIYLLAQATPKPDFVGVYLISVCVSAVGVALCMPQLNSAALKDLGPDQLGQGSAVGQSIRNLGTTIGVSVTIAVLAADPSLASFHRLWIIITVSGVLVSALALLLPRQSLSPTN